MTVRTAFTDLVGVTHPLVAFERSPGVVVEASRAGAFGVLAATAYRPDELDAQLSWIEEHIGGRPYGVDLLVPEQKVGADPARLLESLRAQIPAEHFAFIDSLLDTYGIPPLSSDRSPRDTTNTDASRVPELLDVCFSHDIALIANALGAPPAAMVAGARRAGIPVAALVGTPRHAERQLAAGVDVLVAQGYEAGGHTGEIASMVLVPEVIDLAGDVPVLAAGGIASGRQLAAALTLGAAGGWAGSVWLSTTEDIANRAIKDKLLAATSSDTERDRTRTGKPARQLRSAWHAAWRQAGLDPLPMPLQPLLAGNAWQRIDAAAETGHEGAIELESFFVGQVVGSFRDIRPTAEVVAGMMAECERHLRAAGGLVRDPDPA